MSRERELPDGVPSFNAAPTEGDVENAPYVAPDTATPHFDAPKEIESARLADGAKARRRDIMSREHQNMTLLIAVVALAMAIGGVLLLRSPKAEMLPLCSSQPEWNQFNCRAR